MPEAVIFDLDGVLLDSEQRWNEAKEALVAEAGGSWRAAAAHARGEAEERDVVEALALAAHVPERAVGEPDTSALGEGKGGERAGTRQRSGAHTGRPAYASRRWHSW